LKCFHVVEADFETQQILNKKAILISTIYSDDFS